MKFLNYLLLISIVFSSCNLGSNHSQVFESNKLKGKYNVIFDMEEISKNFKDKNDASNAIGMGFAMLILSGTTIDICFYDNNSGTYSFNMGMLGKQGKFEYKLEQDSIFYARAEGEKKWGDKIILKKFNDTYDLIQFSSGEGKMPFSLKKVMEK